ncbi:hypothetical protein FQN52_000555 [Onygenales sp. PD_12]|nr:hypothetical protein FQN52_000555 [Onygenales sp. PD_12]
MNGDPGSAAEAEACRKALLLSHHFAGHRDLVSWKGVRTPGTCEWIRSNKIYGHWMQMGTAANRILGISGSPGMGKTMVSLFIIEEIQTLAVQNEGTELLHFFCDYQDDKRNTPIAILRGLICQIIEKRPSLARNIWPHLDTNEKAWLTTISLEALWTTFTNILEDPGIPMIFCVIDGLDECDPVSLAPFASKLMDLFSPHPKGPVPQNFRLVVTGQDIPGLSVPTIDLNASKNPHIRQDLRIFVFAKVRELARKLKTNHIVRHRVRETLDKSRKGNFLWTSLVLRHLFTFKTTAEVVESLEYLPDGVHSVYQRLFRGLQRGFHPIRPVIFGWVSMACRPLSLQELEIAIRAHSPKLLEGTKSLVAHIAACGSLLVVCNKKVKLVHKTLRDYLVRETPDQEPALEMFRIHANGANKHLAQACFEYIQNSTLQHAVVDIKDDAVTWESSFLDYAILYWSEHARRSPIYLRKALDLSHPFFREKSQIRQNWWNSYWKAKQRRWEEADIPLLHLLTYLGITPWVQELLTEPPGPLNIHKPVGRMDKYGRKALFYAASAGHTDLVRLLLSHDSNVNAADKFGVTALIEAAAGGHSDCVQLLLSRGADANAVHKKGRNALAIAAFGGHIAVINILLSHGAKPNMIGNGILGRTVLGEAVSAGHVTLVKRLIAQGVDVNGPTTDLFERTALGEAVAGGHRLLVNLLLSHGADVDDKRIHSCTPLGIAGSKHHESPSDPKKEATARQQLGRTPIGEAALLGDKDMVSLLLDHGVDVNGRDIYGRTALHAAASIGDTVLIRFLLSKGAYINLGCGCSRTALGEAAFGGHERAVETLLDCGANVQTTGRLGRAPLAEAVMGRSFEVVKLLLDKGADVNARDNNGGVAIGESPGPEIRELLLNRGAHASDQGGGGRV